jgi:hypothetical protein
LPTAIGAGCAVYSLPDPSSGLKNAPVDLVRLQIAFTLQERTKSPILILFCLGQRA